MKDKRPLEYARCPLDRSVLTLFCIRWIAVFRASGLRTFVSLLYLVVLPFCFCWSVLALKKLFMRLPAAVNCAMFLSSYKPMIVFDFSSGCSVKSVFIKSYAASNAFAPLWILLLMSIHFAHEILSI